MKCIFKPIEIISRFLFLTNYKSISYNKGVKDMVIMISDKVKEVKGVYFLDSICQVKEITDKKNYLLLFNCKIKNDGIIEKLNFSLDEVLLVLPVERIVTNDKSNFLKQTAKFYNIYLDIR